ncbi:MAG: BamA/TamA family outer membrane protein, partial [Nitrospinae bacterium]|nr:BamA/TamA family outer membrane protein [Nitrospinota bacterium]
SWGGVLFLDGGTAYQGETPDYQVTPRFGAGFGVRYMTGFGPVRVDVAVPLSRRESDPPFHVYVGLGQAF